MSLRFMARTIFAGILALGAASIALAPSPAAARVHIGIGIGVPLFAPAYPAPVYVYPPYYYAPPPAYYVPPSPPAYYAPPQVASPALTPAAECREYSTTETIAGAQQQVFGTACRQPDGTWRIVD